MNPPFHGHLIIEGLPWILETIYRIIIFPLLMNSPENDYIHLISHKMVGFIPPYQSHSPFILNTTFQKLPCDFIPY